MLLDGQPISWGASTRPIMPLPSQLPVLESLEGPVDDWRGPKVLQHADLLNLDYIFLCGPANGAADLQEYVGLYSFVNWSPGLGFLLWVVTCVSREDPESLEGTVWDIWDPGHDSES